MQLAMVQAQGAENQAPAAQDQKQKIHAAMMQNVQQLQQLEQAMAAAMAANVKTQQDFEVFQMKLAVEGGTAEQVRTAFP